MIDPSMPIDVEALLQPISSEAPVGDYLRYEGTYDRIQEARREDDANLPQGVWKTALKKATWPEVLKLCTDALRLHSKDLQIAAWLMEALTVQQGFAGAHTGARVIIGLCQRFWEHMYPAVDGDDVSFRLGPMDWLEQRLPLRLKAVLITKPGGDALPYSYADLERAIHREKEERREREKSSDSEASGDDPKAPNQARFRASASLTPRAFHLGLLAELKALGESLTALNALLEERAGSGHVSLRQLHDTISNISAVVQEAVRESPDQGDPGDPGAGDNAAAEATEPAVAAAAAPSVGPGPIRSRAQAYQRLIEAADYLMRTEPHSPAPYLVKRAVSWGNMTLTELLPEIVQSANDLRAIYALLGVRAPGDRGD